MKFSLILLAFLGFVLIVGASEDSKITDDEINELITDYKALYEPGNGITGNVSKVFFQAIKMIFIALLVSCDGTKNQGFNY